MAGTSLSAVGIYFGSGSEEIEHDMQNITSQSQVIIATHFSLWLFFTFIKKIYEVKLLSMSERKHSLCKPSYLI